MATSRGSARAGLYNTLRIHARKFDAGLLPFLVRDFREFFGRHKTIGISGLG